MTLVPCYDILNDIPWDILNKKCQSVLRIHLCSHLIGFAKCTIVQEQDKFPSQFFCMLFTALSRKEFELVMFQFMFQFVGHLNKLINLFNDKFYLCSKYSKS